MTHRYLRIAYAALAIALAPALTTAQSPVLERLADGRIVDRAHATSRSRADDLRAPHSTGVALPQNLSRAAALDDDYFLDSVRYERFDAAGGLRFSSLEAFSEAEGGKARVSAYLSEGYADGVLVDRLARRDSTYDADGRYTVTYFELDTLTGDWTGDYTATYSNHPDSGDHVIENDPIDDPNRSISSTHVTYDTLAGVFAYDLRRETRRIYFDFQPRDTLYFSESFEALARDRERLFFFGSRQREARGDSWDNASFRASHYTGDRFGGDYRREDTLYTALAPDSLRGVGYFELRRGTLAGDRRVDTSDNLSPFSGSRTVRRSYLTLDERGLTLRDSTVGREVTGAGDTTAFARVEELTWLPNAERLSTWDVFRVVDGRRVPDLRYRFYYSRAGASALADVDAGAGACAEVRIRPNAAGHAIDIGLPAGVASARARVIDLAGRPVTEARLGVGEARLALPAGLAPGLYAVEVTHAAGRCAEVVSLH